MYSKSVRVKTINLESYHCPLINREIDMGECYDIQSVRGRLMKKDEFVPDFDREEAEMLCDECPYNQM